MTGAETGVFRDDFLCRVIAVVDNQYIGAFGDLKNARQSFFGKASFQVKDTCIITDILFQELKRYFAGNQIGVIGQNCRVVKMVEIIKVELNIIGKTDSKLLFTNSIAVGLMSLAKTIPTFFMKFPF